DSRVLMPIWVIKNCSCSSVSLNFTAVANLARCSPVICDLAGDTPNFLARTPTVRAQAPGINSSTNFVIVYLGNSAQIVSSYKDQLILKPPGTIVAPSNVWHKSPPL